MKNIEEKLKESGLDYKYISNGKRPKFQIKENGLTVNYYIKTKYWGGQGFTSGSGDVSDLINQLKENKPTNSDFYTNNPESYNAIIGVFQKHFGKKIPEQYKEGIKADLKRRFDIKLR